MLEAELGDGVADTGSAAGDEGAGGGAEDGCHCCAVEIGLMQGIVYEVLADTGAGDRYGSYLQVSVSGVL